MIRASLLAAVLLSFLVAEPASASSMEAWCEANDIAGADNCAEWYEEYNASSTGSVEPQTQERHRPALHPVEAHSEARKAFRAAVLGATP